MQGYIKGDSPYGLSPFTNFYSSLPKYSANHHIGQKIHDNPMAEKLSKMFGQAIYERNEVAKGATIDEAREKFRKRYGQCFY